MKNTTATQPKSLKIKIESHLETIEKHYLQSNLDILLEVYKYENREDSLETAATIIREYEFLSLVNDSKHVKLH